MTAVYTLLFSIKRNRRPSLIAQAAVLPLPPNGSNTMSPRFVNTFMYGMSTGSGFVPKMIPCPYLGLPTFHFQEYQWLFNSTPIWLVIIIPTTILLTNTPFSMAAPANLNAKINNQMPDYSTAGKDFSDWLRENFDVVFGNFIRLMIFVFMMPISLSLLLFFSSLFKIPKAIKLFLAMSK